MKSNLLLLAAAALAALPAAAIAQGTYLTDPSDNSNHAVVVAPGGNVGIGTTEPQAKQHNQIAARSTAFDAGVGTTWHDLVIQNPDSTQNAAVGLAFQLNSEYHQNAGTGIAAVKSNASSDYGADMVFVTRPQGELAAERMRITGTGNVGIGTTNPQRTLSVNGQMECMAGRFGELTSVANHRALTAYYDNSYGNGSDGAGVLQAVRIGVGYTPLVVNPQGGNVGIGTIDPKAKLDVDGKVKCQVLELTSDRNQKQDLAAIDARSILDRLVGLPIMTWAYTNDAKVRHLGPMAQDWKAAYPELGSDDKHIGAGDLGSVALAAIQGLNEKLTESLKVKDAEITALKQELHAFRTDQANFAARVIALEKLMAMATSDDVIFCNRRAVTGSNFARVATESFSPSADTR